MCDVPLFMYVSECAFMVVSVVAVLLLFVVVVSINTITKKTAPNDSIDGVNETNQQLTFLSLSLSPTVVVVGRNNND